MPDQLRLLFVLDDPDPRALSSIGARVRELNEHRTWNGGNAVMFETEEVGGVAKLRSHACGIG